MAESAPAPFSLSVSLASAKGNSSSPTIAAALGEAAGGRLLAGVPPAEAGGHHAELVAAANQTLGRHEKVRRSTMTLAVVRVGWPVPRVEVAADPSGWERYRRFEDAALAWLQADGERRGWSVLSAVRRTDLPRLRLDAFFIAAGHRRLDVRQGHPGWQVKLAGGATGEVRAALAAWRGRFFKEVAQPAGLAKDKSDATRLAEAARAKGTRAAQTRAQAALRLAQRATVKAWAAGLVDVERSRGRSTIALREGAQDNELAAEAQAAAVGHMAALLPLLSALEAGAQAAPDARREQLAAAVLAALN